MHTDLAARRAGADNSQRSTDRTREPGRSPLRHYRLDTASVAIGMWVAELDRPWLDTPFMIRGFRVDSLQELAALRRYCKQVEIDIEKSDIEVVSAIREAEQALLKAEDQATRRERDLTPLARARRRRARGTHSTRSAARAGDELVVHAVEETAPVTRSEASDTLALAPAPVPASASGPTLTVYSASTNERSARRASRSKGEDADRNILRSRDDRIRSTTRLRFQRLVYAATTEPNPGGLRGVLLGLARTIGLASDPAQIAFERKQRYAALRRSLPIDKPRRYRDIRPIEEELPRARTAFTRSCDTVETLLADIRNDRVTDVAQVHAAVDTMVTSIISNPDALMWVTRLRDEDITTYSHGVKVALYMVVLGRHLGFPKSDMNKLGMIGMLADVGKTRVPRALLEKPGMLSTAEYEIVKGHVELGLEALRKSMVLPVEVEQGIAQHHERIDGSGYPLGLSEDAISIYGRIAGIADTFAALITPRAYANACAPQDALMSLFEWAGRSFHAPLVEQFVEAIGIFPVGSFVELSTGEAAIIVAHNRTRRLEPKVLILTWPDKQALPEPIARDLSQRTRAGDGKVIRIVRGLAAGSYGLKIRDYYGRDGAAAS